MWLAVWPGVVTASSAPAGAGDDVAVRQHGVGTEIKIAARLEPADLAGMQRPRSPVRTFGEHRRAGRRLDRRHGGRMVAMGVGDEDVGDGLAANGTEQSRDVPRVVRPGIDDGDVPRPTM